MTSIVGGHLLSATCDLMDGSVFLHTLCNFVIVDVVISFINKWL